MIHGKMAKRINKEQNLELIFKSLLELEKGITNKEVAQLIFQRGSAATKRVKVDTYDQVNKAVLKWFKRPRYENVPVNGVLIKEKALHFLIPQSL